MAHKFYNTLYCLFFLHSDYDSTESYHEDGRHQFAQYFLTIWVQQARDLQTVWWHQYSVRFHPEGTAVPFISLC